MSGTVTRKKSGFVMTRILEPTPEMAAIIEDCVQKCVEGKLEEVVERIIDRRIKQLFESPDVSAKVLELRTMPIEEAKILIERYLADNEGSETSDIVRELRLDPKTVLEALSQLEREGKIRGERVDE